jgi:hypothetical protein
VPHGPNSGLLAAKALRRNKTVAVQMSRLTRRPPRLS